MAEAIGSLVVRIGGDASDLIDAMKKGSNAVQGLQAKVETGVRAMKAFAAALEIREMAVFIQGVADAGDALLKMSERTGIAVESLSELAYSANLANVSNEQLAVGLRNLAKNMVEAQAGSADARQAFIALFGGTWTLKSTEQQLLDIADKFHGMADGAGKSTLAVKLFGKTGDELIPVLNKGSEYLRANAEEARKLGITLSTEAAKDAADFTDSMKKLEAASAAAARAISGDMVKALTAAADEMLRARKESASLLEQYQRFVITLFFGDDTQRFNKELDNAEARLAGAEKQLAAARAAAQSDNGRMWPEQAAASVAKYTAAVAAAQAEVNRLRSIKPILIPDKPEEKKGTGAAPQLEDLAKARAAAEEEARRTVAAEEQAAQDSREAWALYFQFLDQVGTDTTHQLEIDAQGKVAAIREVVLKSGQYFLDVEERMYAAGLAAKAFDDQVQAEADAAVNREAQKHGDQLGELSAFMKTEADLEDERYAEALARLQNFSDEELSALGGRHAVEQQMERDHQARMLAIRASGLTNLAAFSKASWGDQTKTVIAMLTEMTAAAATKNKTMFEINKVAATANAVVKGWEAVQSSYAFGASWGGPVAGAAMAAIAAAATLANVVAIQGTSFGAATAPSVGATPAPAVTPVTAAGQQQSSPVQTTVINLPGQDFVSTKVIRALLEHINENTRNGGRILVQGG